MRAPLLHMNHSRPGELARVVPILLVFPIAMVLLVLVVMWVQRLRVRENNTRVLFNLGQLAMSCHVCQDVHGRLPPAFDKFGKMDFAGSLHVHLAPCIDEKEFYERYLESAGKGEVAEAVIPSYVTFGEDGTPDDLR